MDKKDLITELQKAFIKIRKSSGFCEEYSLWEEDDKKLATQVAKKLHKKIYLQGYFDAVRNINLMNLLEDKSEKESYERHVTK